MNDAPQTVPTTCIALPNKFIFIDCGVNPDLASNFREDMEKKYQKNVRIYSSLILTFRYLKFKR
ncbi:MAG: hypothetical protein ACFFBI_13745 [Promethearchaeota archaeon]